MTGHEGCTDKVTIALGERTVASVECGEFANHTDPLHDRPHIAVAEYPVVGSEEPHKPVVPARKVTVTFRWTS